MRRRLSATDKNIGKNYRFGKQSRRGRFRGRLKMAKSPEFQHLSELLMRASIFLLRHLNP